MHISTRNKIAIFLRFALTVFLFLSYSYATLVDINAEGDDEGLLDSEPLTGGAGTHLSELLDLTGM